MCEAYGLNGDCAARLASQTVMDTIRKIDAAVDRLALNDAA
jgi:hypothetical protein